MFGLDTVMALIQAHGIWLLIPVSVIEGPIVTVIASYLASMGVLNIWAVTLVVILGDLAGDLIFYGAGRWGAGARWTRRLGLTEARLSEVTGHFDEQGPRTLFIGKWTHSVGAAVLFAAGVARMPFGRFMFWNTLAAVPKCLVFVAVGWFFGHLYARIDHWLGRISLVMLVLAALAALIWWWRRNNRKDKAAHDAAEQGNAVADRPAAAPGAVEPSTASTDAPVTAPEMKVATSEDRAESPARTGSDTAEPQACDTPRPPAAAGQR